MAHDRPDRHVRIGIIGSGFAGIGAAIRLKQERNDDFLVFERANDVGGVWRDNTYPGCACDVQSHLYCFSFAPNPDWSHSYSPQGEIWGYLRGCVERFGIAPHLRFGHAIESATWDAHAQRWRLETSQGAYTCEVLVGAVGALSEPSLPSLPGLENFRGHTFHSARWDHDYPLEGKRVAAIGTGASAIQFVPQIQPRVAQLSLFQRTPPWIVPRNDFAYSDADKRRLRASRLRRAWTRGAIYVQRELMATAFLHPRLARVAERLVARHLERAVKDPELRRKLTPDYRFGCKRILVSDDYLPAVQQPNVDVVTSAIAEVTARGLRTADGREHAVDAIIFGTGFQVTDMPFARVVRGRDGRTLDETWGGSMRAHLGMAIAGFPNLYIIPGPNSGLGHSSMILMIEAQLEQLMQTLRWADRRGFVAVEPRAEAQARWVASVDAKMGGTVWATGCKSWYLDRTGRNSTLWPSYTFSFMRRLRRFRSGDYVGEALRGAPVELDRRGRIEERLARRLGRSPWAWRLAGAPIVVDGQTLAPDLQALLRLHALTSRNEGLTEGDVLAARERLRRESRIVAGAPVAVGGVEELRLDGGLTARHYRPFKSEGAPLVVFLHGGGMALGDVETHDAVCRRLCHGAGVHVLSIDYRRAPEAPFPAAADDALAAWDWACKNASALGADAQRIAIAGDSAGGNLSAVVALDARETGRQAPVLQLLLYPALDRTRHYRSLDLFASGFVLTRADVEAFELAYAGPELRGARHPRISPAVVEDLAGLAPAIVVTAGFDPLRDEGERHAQRLQAAGVPTILRRYDGLVHGFANLAGVSESAAVALDEIVALVREQLHAPAPEAGRKPRRRPPLAAAPRSA